MANLGNLVKSIRDIMRKDAGVDGDAQRISQMVWMIFLKVFDSMEQEREAEDESYKSPLPEKIRWRNWAVNPEGMTGDELLDFVNNNLFKTLKNLKIDEKTDQRGYIIKQVFEDAYNYMKNGILVRQVVNKINEMDFTSAEDRHLFNDVYETILRELQSAGSAGEFYTPRPVTQFIVDMVNPKLGDIVLDPACGTGGFLISVLNHLKKDIKTIDDQKVLEKTLRGIEKKPLPHLLCMTNMILHDIEVPNIRHDNSLARPIIDYSSKDMVNIVVTNPPFGGAEEEGIENNFPAEFRTRETADLFLILIMKLLRDGGKCGIILPDSLFIGDGIKIKIKEKLLSEFNLHTVVKLPRGVFSPYTDIPTNILFFDRDRPTKEIWYFEHPIPEEYKIYTKTKPIRLEEFELEKRWWNNRESIEFKPFCWKVSIDEIITRKFNLDIANPNKVNESHNIEELSRIFKENNKKIASLEKDIELELEKFPLLKINLNLFSKDEDSIKKLKEFILEKAIRGELVLPLEDNKDAKKLLNEMSEEKLKLLFSRKIKAEKPLLKISEEEIPFKLPSNCVWAKFTDVAYFKMGKTPSRDNSSYWANGIYPWVSIADLNHHKLVNQTKEKISQLAADKVFLSQFTPRGTLLMSFKLTLGKLSELNIDAYHNEAIISIFPYNPQIKRYLRYCLPTMIDFQKSKKNAIKGKTLNRDSLSKIIIPLPSLSEQRRIVERLDKLLSLCDELEKQVKENQENAQKLMSTVLKESFEVK